MEQGVSKASRVKILVYFSLVQACTWITITGWGFLVPYLQHVGLNSTQVGMTIALNGLMGVIAPPFWGRLADRLHSARKVFIVMLIGSALLWFCIPIAGSLPGVSMVMMSVLLQASMLFIRPLVSILDSWVMHTLPLYPGVEYGSVRVWGSIGSCLSSMAMTACIRWWGIGCIFPAYLLCAVPTTVLCLCYRGKEGAPARVHEPAARQGTLRDLLREKQYVLLLALLMAMNVPVNNGYTYISYLILQVQGDTAMVGVYTGLRAAFEIPCVLLCGVLLKKRAAGRLICLPAVCMIAEQLLYTLCTSTTQILCVAPLGGMAYGFFVPCMVRYTAELAPHGMEATAQAVSGSMYSLTGIVCNVLGGWAIGMLGAKLYYALCGTLVAGMLLMFATGSRIPKGIRQQANG